MQHMRSHLPAFVLYLGMFAACVALAAVPGCTKNTRLTTLQASLVAVNAARDGFITWDRQHQSALVQAATSREDAIGKLESYRKERESVIHGFESAYRVLAVAATQTDDPSLKSALAQSAELVAAIKKLTGGP